MEEGGAEGGAQQALQHEENGEAIEGQTKRARAGAADAALQKLTLAEGQLAKLVAAVASANDNMKHGTAKTEVHRREVVAVAATTALVFGGVCCVCFCSCCCCCCCCADAAAAALVCREHNFCSLELLLSTAPVL